eukprot:scaffold40638_cov42-Cyclotella_meneghiniana.AAC.2
MDDLQNPSFRLLVAVGLGYLQSLLEMFGSVPLTVYLKMLALVLAPCTLSSVLISLQASAERHLQFCTVSHFV